MWVVWGGEGRGGGGGRGEKRRRLPAHLFVFQVCRISWSWMPSSAACRSRKSKRHLMAFGRGRPRGMANIAWKRASTYGWRIRCLGEEREEREGKGRGGGRGKEGGGGEH